MLVFTADDPDNLLTRQDSLDNDSTELTQPLIPEITEIEKRSPSGALLRSAVLPGWGQLYNDEPLKGVIFCTVEIGLLSWLISEHIASENARNSDNEASYTLHSQRRLDLIWYTSAAWLFGMLDAYVDAYLYSFSTENEQFEKETGLGIAVFIDL